MSLFVLASKDGWVNIMYTGLDAVGVDQQVSTSVGFSIHLFCPLRVSGNKYRILPSHCTSCTGESRCRRACPDT